MGSGEAGYNPANRPPCHPAPVRNALIRRIQQLRISLAAKCQLLFGAAVLLIIAAALFVPWHRIEQLTEQLNERTASYLVERAVAEHVAGRIFRSEPDGVAAAVAFAGRAATGPSKAGAISTTQPAPADDPPPAPRLTAIGPRRENTDLARFEVRAASHFVRDRDSPSYSAYFVDPRDGAAGYRYAQPLRFGRACAACHRPVAAADVVAALTRPSTRPASRPAAAAVADVVGPPGGTSALVPVPVDPLPSAADPGLASDASGTPLAGVVSVEFPSRIDTEQLYVNRIAILVALGLASFLAVVTFYSITTKLILQPVRVLQETADKVAKGDLNIRSDISTGDEFQQLSETFNAMLTTLKRSADQLRAMNKSLDLRLGQLAESNVALFESNRLKSEFLANVSHELRTPLNSILGFADLLRDATNAPPEAKSNRYITNILTSGKHLLDLINDLLDLAK
ncbi:MAG: putative two-component system sensor histidine kinase, partial [Phycisphaerales bacterium]|nr:putative two-component system sensor histidine kinase [Phycisphaerales bacterium]